MSNLSANAKRTPIRRVVGAIIIVVFFIGIIDYAYHNWFLIERLDDYMGVSDAQKESYFDGKFPSSADIKEYLSDATIIVSHPPMNSVYYFYADNKILYWQVNNIIRAYWYTEKYFHITSYKDRWRFDFINVFCFRFVTGYPGECSCNVAGKLNRLMAYGSPDPEYRKGNIFHLSETAAAPFLCLIRPLNRPVSPRCG